MFLKEGSSRSQPENKGLAVSIPKQNGEEVVFVSEYICLFNALVFSTLATYSDMHGLRRVDTLFCPPQKISLLQFVPFRICIMKAQVLLWQLSLIIKIEGFVVVVVLVFLRYVFLTHNIVKK